MKKFLRHLFPRRRNQRGDPFVCGPRGEVRVGQGRRTFANVTSVGWVVYRDWDPRASDPVFIECHRALEYARRIVSGPEEVVQS
jgi:hypothetical protein